MICKYVEDPRHTVRRNGRLLPKRRFLGAILREALDAADKGQTYHVCVDGTWRGVVKSWTWGRVEFVDMQGEGWLLTSNNNNIPNWSKL
mgnify:CR=1 FL=1|tara:strand:+ start:12978 stop:13244 length:267 start_codon:yes stop_codon:yes gene_type:complete